MSQDNILDQLITETDLPVRALKCLKSRGLIFLGELVQLTEYDLLRTKNLGRVTLRHIKNMLESKGLSLDTETDWSQPYHVDKDDSESFQYEGLMDPENMMACRRLLASGWCFARLSRQFLNCTPQKLKAYLKETWNPYSQTLNRMIEDGLILSEQPLGQYICYLMDRLDKLSALRSDSDPTRQADINYSISMHSARLLSALNANRSVKINQSKTWIRTEPDEVLEHNLVKSLNRSYKRNIRCSWVAEHINAFDNRYDMFPHYLHGTLRHYNTDLNVASILDNYQYNEEAIVRLCIINGQAAVKSENQ